ISGITAWWPTKLSTRNPNSPVSSSVFLIRVIFCSLLEKLAAHTGLEPVISALRGQRVNQLHQCAAERSGIIEGVVRARKVNVESLLLCLVVNRSVFCFLLFLQANPIES